MIEHPLFLFFCPLFFPSHNLLVHLIGVSGSATRRGGGGERKRSRRKEKKSMGWGKRKKKRDGHKQIEPDRDKASACHAQKKEVAG